MGMHNELWFPSVIWSSIVHSIDNSSIKRYAYERKKSDQGKSILNQGGWSSSTILPGENYQMDKLMDLLRHEVDTCRKQVGLTDIQLHDIWININPTGSYIKPRIHPDSIFSGIYFVSAVKQGGDIQFERTDRGEYHLTDSLDQNNYYNATHARYASRNGALYVFPGWLRYHVDGNLSSDDQISVGFIFGKKQ
jgi:uncharacterized protein (TIGR02466 family)